MPDSLTAVSDSEMRASLSFATCSISSVAAASNRGGAPRASRM